MFDILAPLLIYGIESGALNKDFMLSGNYLFGDLFDDILADSLINALPLPCDGAGAVGIAFDEQSCEKRGHTDGDDQ